MRRDMTKGEFDAACKRRGFKPAMLGYYLLPDTNGLNVFAANAGPNRRHQLAYLIREQEVYAERKRNAETACES